MFDLQNTTTQNKAYFLSQVILCLLIVFAIGSNTANANNPEAVNKVALKNLIIMGMDADPDSVSRNSRIHKRVLAAIANELIDRNYYVYDETALTFNTLVQMRERRNDPELITIAKQVSRPPLDIMVLFRIYFTIEKKLNTQQVLMRVEGRLLDVKTGRRLGNVESVSPSSWSVGIDCSRECILEDSGLFAKFLASDMASFLSDKLDCLLGRNPECSVEYENGFYIVFDGFDSDQTQTILEKISLLASHIQIDIAELGQRSTIWYSTTAEMNQLQREMRQLMKEVEINVEFKSMNNVIVAYKLNKRANLPKKKPKPSDW